MPLVVNLPEETEERLRYEAGQQGMSVEQYAAQRLLNKLSPPPRRYGEFSEVLLFLAELPEPREVLALEEAPELRARVSELVARKNSEGLTVAEQQEWASYEALTQVVDTARAKAEAKLQT